MAPGAGSNTVLEGSVSSRPAERTAARECSRRTVPRGILPVQGDFRQGFREAGLSRAAGEVLSCRVAGSIPTTGSRPLVCAHCRLGATRTANRLYFLVRLNLARSWVQRVHRRRVRGLDLGLGPYPLISLAEARRLAIENLLTIRAGGNPKGDAGRKKGPTATVVDLLEVVIENRSPGWKAKKKTEAVWRHDFKKYVFPAIGGKPIATVTVADVRDIVLPHWRGRNSKGSVLRQNLESLFGCAVAYGYRLDNPAAHVRAHLAEVRGS